jgi:hypothetical protein
MSSQAVTILTDLKAITDQSRCAFPYAQSQQRPMSDATVLAALA